MMTQLTTFMYSWSFPENGVLTEGAGVPVRQRVHSLIRRQIPRSVLLKAARVVLLGSCLPSVSAHANVLSNEPDCRWHR